MERDDDVLVLGQDVGADGGVFRVTEGLLEKFGEQRVIDTPLAEGGIVGMAVGLALHGLKPVAEIQFSGFSFQAFHQIENHAARFQTRSQGRYRCQLVVRMPYGAGVRALEHHSESEEAHFAHVPGLKVVIPSGPRTARALLASAIADPGPVIFMEPKARYHALREDLPEEDEHLPLGQARVLREGRHATVVAYGAMVVQALDAAAALERDDGVLVEVIDLMTISPMDGETIARSAAKTGRVVVVHEAARTCGVGAEVTARIVERAFLHLEAPVRRLTAFDVPYSGFAREKVWLPDAARIARAVRDILAF
jgi:pyruvate dehydrogenase E1 component beta subunit